MSFPDRLTKDFPVVIKQARGSMRNITNESSETLVETFHPPSADSLSPCESRNRTIPSKDGSNDKDMVFIMRNKNAHKSSSSESLDISQLLTRLELDEYVEDERAYVPSKQQIDLDIHSEHELIDILKPRVGIQNYVNDSSSSNNSKRNDVGLNQFAWMDELDGTTTLCGDKNIGSTTGKFKKSKSDRRTTRKQLIHTEKGLEKHVDDQACRLMTISSEEERKCEPSTSAKDNNRNRKVYGNDFGNAERSYQTNDNPTTYWLLIIYQEQHPRWVTEAEVNVLLGRHSSDDVRQAASLSYICNGDDRFHNSGTRDEQKTSDSVLLCITSTRPPSVSLSPVKPRALEEWWRQFNTFLRSCPVSTSPLKVTRSAEGDSCFPVDADLGGKEKTTNSSLESHGITYNHETYATDLQTQIGSFLSEQNRTAVTQKPTTKQYFIAGAQYEGNFQLAGQVEAYERLHETQETMKQITLETENENLSKLLNESTKKIEKLEKYIEQNVKDITTLEKKMNDGVKQLAVSNERLELKTKELHLMEETCIAKESAITDLRKTEEKTCEQAEYEANRCRELEIKIEDLQSEIENMKYRERGLSTYSKQLESSIQNSEEQLTQMKSNFVQVQKTSERMENSYKNEVELRRTLEAELETTKGKISELTDNVRTLQNVKLAIVEEKNNLVLNYENALKKEREKNELIRKEKLQEEKKIIDECELMKEKLTQFGKIKKERDELKKKTEYLEDTVNTLEKKMENCIKKHSYVKKECNERGLIISELETALNRFISKKDGVGTLQNSTQGLMDKVTEYKNMVEQLENKKKELDKELLSVRNENKTLRNHKVKRLNEEFEEKEGGITGGNKGDFKEQNHPEWNKDKYFKEEELLKKRQQFAHINDEALVAEPRKACCCNSKENECNKVKDLEEELLKKRLQLAHVNDEARVAEQRYQTERMQLVQEVNELQSIVTKYKMEVDILKNCGTSMWEVQTLERLNKELLKKKVDHEKEIKLLRTILEQQQQRMPLLTDGAVRSRELPQNDATQENTAPCPTIKVLLYKDNQKTRGMPEGTAGYTDNNLSNNQETRKENMKLHSTHRELMKQVAQLQDGRRDDRLFIKELQSDLQIEKTVRETLEQIITSIQKEVKNYPITGQIPRKCLDRISQCIDTTSTTKFCLFTNLRKQDPDKV